MQSVVVHQPLRKNWLLAKPESAFASCAPRGHEMDFTGLLDRPIAFHRCFVPIAGGVAGAVFLSQLLYWARRIPSERDGWMWKSGKEWEEETGLRRGEQESARKKLRDVGVLQEERKGVPARLHFRLDVNKLASLLNSTNLFAEFDKQVCGNPTNKFAGFPQTNTETTAKNTKLPPQVGGSGSGSCDLIFPSTSPTEQKSLAGLVAGLDYQLAQQILDEVTGNMRAGTIRKTPATLCRTLVNRANTGEFTPELANAIADERDRASRTSVQTSLAADSFPLDKEALARTKQAFPTIAARMLLPTIYSASAESVCE
jgi:hypothetical protein